MKTMFIPAALVRTMFDPKTEMPVAPFDRGKYRRTVNPLYNESLPRCTPMDTRDIDCTKKVHKTK